MASIIHISEAVSIGLHAALCLNSEPGRNWSVREIIGRYRFSEAHVAKVMASLARAGIVVAVRGPHGGARLRRPADQVTLLAIYEAIDGPMRMDSCLLASEGCGSECCRLGHMLAGYHQSMRTRFAATTLADFSAMAQDTTGEPAPAAARPAAANPDPAPCFPDQSGFPQTGVES